MNCTPDWLSDLCVSRLKSSDGSTLRWLVNEMALLGPEIADAIPYIVPILCSAEEPTAKRHLLGLVTALARSPSDYELALHEIEQLRFHSDESLQFIAHIAWWNATGQANAAEELEKLGNVYGYTLYGQFPPHESAALRKSVQQFRRAAKDTPWALYLGHDAKGLLKTAFQLQRMSGELWESQRPRVDDYASFAYPYGSLLSRFRRDQDTISMALRRRLRGDVGRDMSQIEIETYASLLCCDTPLASPEDVIAHGELMKHDNWEIRFAVLTALGACEKYRDLSIPAFCAGLRDVKQEVKMAAAHGVAKLYSPAKQYPEELQSALNHALKHPKTGEVLIAVSSAINESDVDVSECETALLDFLQGERVWLCQAAAHACGALLIDTPPIRKALQDLSRHPHQVVRLKGSGALFALTNCDREFINRATKALKSDQTAMHAALHSFYAFGLPQPLFDPLEGLATRRQKKWWALTVEICQIRDPTRERELASLALQCERDWSIATDILLSKYGEAAFPIFLRGAGEGFPPAVAALRHIVESDDALDLLGLEVEEILQKADEFVSPRSRHWAYQWLAVLEARYTAATPLIDQSPDAGEAFDDMELPRSSQDSGTVILSTDEEGNDILSSDDLSVVANATRLLWKIIRSRTVKATQIVAIGVALEALERLPKLSYDTATNIVLSYSVDDDRSNILYWSIETHADGMIEICSGGTCYSDDTGSDSYTKLEWWIDSSQEAEHRNYQCASQESISRAFEAEIEAIDLEDSGYEIRVE